ncbi:MAG: hypothetical protein J7K87_01235 [Candidatus Aenigmarchaeota archaeon]|nr:hypothetical protein [Candidatus Aenigmarchaeota archaeon]
MKPRNLIFVVLMFLVIFSTYSLAIQIIVWIEGSVGIGINAPKKLIVPLGDKNGTWITVMNVGDIDDIIRIEGSLEPKNDWIKFSFKCGETVGQCDDTPSSGIHTVDNMRLTPEINTTQFYIEVYGYRTTSSMSQTPKIVLTAYSLTNYTKDSDLADIEIDVVNKNKSGTKELPGISTYGAAILVSIASIVFYEVV